MDKDAQILALQARVKHLESKEIRGDRRIVWLEHEKMILLSLIRKAWTAAESYKVGEFNEWRGGPENELPDFSKWYEENVSKNPEIHPHTSPESGANDSATGIQPVSGEDT